MEVSDHQIPQHESVSEILENKSKKRKFPEFLNNLVEISKGIPESNFVQDADKFKRQKLDESQKSINQSLTKHPAFTKMQLQNIVAQS